MVTFCSEYARLCHRIFFLFFFNDSGLSHSSSTHTRYICRCQRPLQCAKQQYWQESLKVETSLTMASRAGWASHVLPSTSGASPCGEMSAPACEDCSKSHPITLVTAYSHSCGAASHTPQASLPHTILTGGTETQQSSSDLHHRNTLADSLA